MLRIGLRLGLGSASGHVVDTICAQAVLMRDYSPHITGQLSENLTHEVAL